MRGMRIPLAIILGILTFGVGSFAQGGALHPRPPLTIAIIMALYLALAQFLVAKKGLDLWANRATLIGMGGPVVGMFILTVFAEIGPELKKQALIFYLPGCLGILLGALAAGVWGTKSGSAEETRP